jgi:hypothetical protein
MREFRIYSNGYYKWFVNSSGIIEYEFYGNSINMRYLSNLGYNICGINLDILKKNR